MIINFRLFEAKNILPDYNDYIIISSEYLDEDHTTVYNQDVKNFIDNNVGILTNKIESSGNVWTFFIKYENVPKDILNLFLKSKYNRRDDIARASFTVYFNDPVNLVFDKNKEHLELKLVTTKFNL